MAGVGRSDLQVKKPCSINNEDWMQNLPASKHKIPLNQLALPGSHDSFSFFLDKTSDVGPDTSQAIRDLVKVFGGMAKDVIYRWSKTQSLNFVDQLRAGIRYFDLRVASKPGNEDMYFIHCLYGSKVESSLQEINGFLEEHPKEVIILDFNHFYGMNESIHTQFRSLIIDVFGSKMCPATEMGNLTLDMMWQNNFQAIVIYQDASASEMAQFWSSSCIRSPWANTTDPAKLSAFLETTYNDGHPKDQFLSLQGVLTPDATYIMSRFTGCLKNDLVAKADPLFVQWIKKKENGKNPINICNMDYVEQAGYIGEVISLNK